MRNEFTDYTAICEEYKLSIPYEVFLANTAKSKDIHYRLRYEVYCEETQFEDLSRYPDRKEIDEYDDHSVHFLVRCTTTKRWVAAMRLVLPQNIENSLPVFSHKESEIEDRFRQACRNALEISRLCIKKDYRGSRAKRLIGESTSKKIRSNIIELPQIAIQRKNQAKRECSIMLALIRAAFAYGHAHKIDFGIALMGAPLARILRMAGFDAKPIGKSFEFRGMRRPYLFDIDTITANFSALQKSDKKIAFSKLDYKLFSEPQNSVDDSVMHRHCG